MMKGEKIKMTVSEILASFAAIAFLIGIIVFMMSLMIIFLDGKKEGFIAFAISILLLGFAIYGTITSRIMDEESYNHAIAEKYEVYIDGIQVNAENIDISNYRRSHITYDDENHKILISTDKR